ncbi:MAG: histidine ammonia-lyase [Oscillospiraceae bacterium]
MNQVIIGEKNLTIEEFINVARGKAQVSLSPNAIERINKSRAVVDGFVDNCDVVYGITTGFGKFSNVSISKEDSALLQKNLIITHAVGAGNPFPEEVVRGMLLLRINNISKGFSGARLILIETLIEMLNKNLVPFVPEKGSLGASGDLAPLSHLILPLLGLGKAYFNGELLDGAEAMKKANIKTMELSAKEGLALINGTQAMTSVGTLATWDALQLSKAADIIACLSVEAQNGIVDAFDPRLHELRPHCGQIDTAKNLRQLLAESDMTTRQGEIRVQDAYSLRCLPQIHGASKDAIRYVLDKIEIEINAVTDNPIIFPDTNEGISGGNFHGQPMALSFDFLGIALAELANVSERRIERLVNPSLSELPAFLVENGGLNSGFMIVQYSAAALVSENKVLAHPASVDSIPSSANQEDHVSMGTIAARKAMEILKNVRRVLAMEMMCACQGIDLRGKQSLGIGTEPVYQAVRDVVTKLEEDRPLYEDINKCEELLINGTVVNTAENAAGKILA